MRKTPATTIAGAITLVALGALTSFALRPAANATPAARVDVRTQIVRRTVWIVTHEKPTAPHRSGTPAAGAPPHPGTSSPTTVAGTAGTTAVPNAPRTSASRARSTTAAPTSSVTTGSSAQPANSSTSAAPAPVTTHTSGSTSAKSTGTTGTTPAGKGGTTTGKPVTTRSSGGGEKGDSHDN